MDANDFLQAITSNCQEAGSAIVTCNAEEGYKARRWIFGRVLEGTVYFCISTVRDTNPRQQVLGRQTADLIETFAIVLDDVGTKVDESRIRLQPTWKMRTSPANHQWGYQFTRPVEPARAAALIETLARAGLTDEGAKRADRIMRLPGSLNTKHDPPFASELVEWTGRTYTFSELCAGLGVTPTDTPALPSTPPALPAGMTDPVLDALLDLQWVLGPANPRGWYPIRCPNQERHSGKVDHGSDYLPGMPGVFKCQHEHCQSLTTTDLKKALLEAKPSLDLSIIPKAQLEGIGRRLAASLGVDADGLWTSQAGGAEHAPEGLFELLARQASKGSIFDRPDALVVASDRVQTLAQHLSRIAIGPEDLQDPDVTQGGKLAVHQTVTAPRVYRVMDRIGMTVRQNVLTGGLQCLFDGFDAFEGAEADTAEAMEALTHVCSRCGMRNAGRIHEIVLLRASQNRYSPVAEWITSAPWDGRSRLRDLYETITMRAPVLNKWRDAAMRRWLIQCVAAIRNWEDDTPTDLGHVLVLQSTTQGENKSKWFKALLPEPWVTIGITLRLDMNERDAVARATRTPITELGELDHSFKRSDVSALRNFLTTPKDIYRPPYGRVDLVKPRCTSFGASVNPEGFLVDQTGNRRFWPLAVAHCNDEHGIDMQQLWAEVWLLEAEGEPFWLLGDEIRLHHDAVNKHMAPSDVQFILEDLKAREQFCHPGEYVHANAKDLCRHYLMKGGMGFYIELNAGLSRAGYLGATVMGKRGFKVPPYMNPLSAAQRSGFVLLKGGLEEGKDRKEEDKD